MINRFHFTLSISMILFLICFLCPQIDAQDRNTVLLYTFDMGEGDIAKDISGNNNDGTLMGPKWDDGKFKGGLIFSGNAARDFVEIPDSGSLDLEDGLTVEMWIFLNTPSTGGGTGVTKEGAYKAGPRSDRTFLLRMTTTTKAWGSAVVFGNTELPLKKWVHTASTYDADSGEGKVYIDGEIDNEGDIGGKIVTNDVVLWLGRGAGPFLDGYIDEVRISNIARTQKEIQDLMEIGIEGVLSVSPKDKIATTWGKIKTRSIQ